MPSVFISGATKGIGRATALHLDRLGWRVFAGFRSPDDADALRRDASERLTPVRLDVTRADDRRAAAEMVGDRLDALVNNAGLVLAGPLEFLPEDRLAEQLNVNVLGVVTLTQAMIPALRTARGRIVNVSSVNGRIATPFSIPYAASKFALEAFSDGFRLELRPWGIRTVVIQPGAIATPIWETSRERAVRVSGGFPAAANDLYGGVLSALANVRTPRRAIPPERVARVIARALTARRPRARYVVGRDARLALLLRAVLPTRWFDRLLAGRRRG